MDSNDVENLLIVRNSTNDQEIICAMQKMLCEMMKDGVIVLPKNVEIFAVPKSVQIVY